VKLVVDVGLGGVGAGSGERVTAGVAAEHSLELCDLVHKGLAARCEVARHIALVRSGAAREHRGHERSSARAADVAREVGEAGDVVVFRLLHANVGDRVDRDEEECETRGLEAAQKDEASVAYAV